SKTSPSSTGCSIRRCMPSRPHYNCARGDCRWSRRTWLSSPGVPDAALPRRDALVISASLALLAALAWAYLVHLAHSMSASARMADMGMSMAMPWTAADLCYTFAMWDVMMVGMMAGSAAPVLLRFAQSQAGRGGGVRAATLLFGLGYLIVWTGFSAAAAFAQWGLHEAALLSPAMAASSPRLAGAILLAAGAYQFAPLKQACLSHCRTPLASLVTRWRDGSIGALRMGLAHGAHCLGCCGALMLVLFGVGVMNL